MKPLMLIVPLFCLAAGDELPGWKMRVGEWSCKEGTIRSKSTELCSLDSNEVITGDFSIEFKVKVTAREQPGIIGVNVCHVGGPGQDFYEFNINTVTDKMCIARWSSAEKQHKLLCEHSCKVPDGRPVPVTIARKANVLAFTVHKIKLTHKETDPPPGKMLTLRTVGVVAEFSKMKVETK